MYIEILWKRGEIAPQEQFFLFSTIFYNLILDFCAVTRTRFFLRDKRLFEITEVEITRVDCIYIMATVCDRSDVEGWRWRPHETENYII